jgi:hypothetical protein
MLPEGRTGLQYNGNSGEYPVYGQKLYGLYLRNTA